MNGHDCCQRFCSARDATVESLVTGDAILLSVTESKCTFVSTIHCFALLEHRRVVVGVEHDDCDLREVCEAERRYRNVEEIVS